MIFAEVQNRTFGRTLQNRAKCPESIKCKEDCGHQEKSKKNLEWEKAIESQKDIIERSSRRMKNLLNEVDEFYANRQGGNVK